MIWARIFPAKLMTITRTLTKMTFVDVPMEFGCATLTFLLYLYTHQSEWLYFSIPSICGMHYLGRTKRVIYYGTPALFVIYMTGVYHAGFPHTLMLTSWIAALAMLCLSDGICISNRIYQLFRHFFTALYYTAFVILLLVILYVMASMGNLGASRLQITLFKACVFCFLVILPSLFLVVDLHRRKESVRIPRWLAWTQLVIAETAIQVGVIYLGYCIIQMAFLSLTPKPYVVYIVLTLFLIVETGAKLHEWVPRKWNDLFFYQRNLIYIPLLFLGMTALYIEFSIVGFSPRTLAASILFVWMTVICLARLTNIQYIKKRERILSFYTAICLIGIIFIYSIVF